MSLSQNPSESQQLHFFDYLRILTVRWPVILVIFLLVVISTGVITFLLPKQYEATALIQVQQNADFEIFQSRSGGGASFDPRFTTTQFEIIKSKEILEPVVEKLGLAELWAEKYEIRSEGLLLRKLDSMITLREVRNTDLISISALSPDREQAPEIANTIADEYQKARIREQQEWVSKSLATLQNEVEKQRSKTEKLRQAAAALRIEYSINDLNPESSEGELQAGERVLLSVEQDVSSQRLKTASLRAKYRQLAQMSDSEIMRSVATLEVEDSTILQILPLYQEAASEEARLLNEGLGANHPTVKAQQAKAAVYLEQLMNQTTSLRTALAVNLAIEEESLANLEEKLSETRDDQQNSKTRSALYYEAKNNYIQAKNVLEAAETRFWTESMQRSMPLNPAIIWSRADVPEFPSRPRVFLNMALGIFFGIVMGVGVAFFIEYLDTSVKTMEDIERYFDLPVLAVVPKGTGILMDLPPDAMDAEPYRILRTNIEFNRKAKDMKILTLVSGGAGEGKSTTLSNLAYTFAQSGLKTLIVDADLRRPSQHRIFGFSNSRGLTDYLSKGVPISDLIMDTKVERLQMVPSGKLPPGAIAMLNSRRMSELLDELRSMYDMVLVDAPPILGVSDSSVIVRSVDMTALVIQHRRFPRAMLARVKSAVINAGGNLLGAVLNNVDIRMDQYYQYQTNYYAYHEEGGGRSGKVGAAKSAASSAAKKQRREDLLVSRPSNSGDY